MKLILPILLLLPIHTEAASAPQQNPARYGTDEQMRCPIEIHPGISLGQLELGQTREAVKSMGLKAVAITSLPEAEIIGRYSVGYEQGRIRRIEISLKDAPNCLRYKNERIPKKSTAAELAKF
ncbi:MAG: hypothetical protein EOP11_22795, partial [Proteobacteria bacterium]